MHEINGLLGLAKRSGNVISGDGLIKSIQSGKAKLVIISEECGENLRKKLVDKCTYYKIPYVYMEEFALNQLLGSMNRKAIAIKEQGFAQKLHACLKG